MKHLLISLILSIPSFVLAKAGECLLLQPGWAADGEGFSSAERFLDSKGPLIAGLPEGKFPVRKLEYVAFWQETAIFLVSFRESQWLIMDGKTRVGVEPPAFYQAFSYRYATKHLTPLLPPKNANGDHRMWNLHALVAGCKPVLSLTYAPCTECDLARVHHASLAFDAKTKTWKFQ